jgi:putative transcriptional regulator
MEREIPSNALNAIDDEQKRLAVTIQSNHLENRLKELRAQQGFTQAELAAAVGVTRKTINTVENKVFTPSTILALKLAAVFGVSVEKLFYLQ